MLKNPDERVKEEHQDVRNATNKLVGCYQTIHTLQERLADENLSDDKRKQFKK